MSIRGLKRRSSWDAILFDKLQNILAPLEIGPSVLRGPNTSFNGSGRSGCERWLMLRYDNCDEGVIIRRYMYM